MLHELFTVNELSVHDFIEGVWGERGLIGIVVSLGVGV